MMMIMMMLMIMMMMLFIDTKADMWSIGVIMYTLLGGYLPFHIEEDEDGDELLRQRIKRGLFCFHEEYWRGISQEAMDLIKKLLAVNPWIRLTASEALMHPWFTEDEDLHGYMGR